ncbi:MAG: metalloregulator ArsR/SmtB family transcription factor [Pseudomonadota bacterium]
MTYATTIVAIADPTRRAILERIRAGEASVGEIAACLPVTRPAVSQHLRVLCDAGLLTVRQAGTRRLYRLAPNGAADLRAWLDAMWADALSSFAAEARARATSEKGTHK